MTATETVISSTPPNGLPCRQTPRPMLKWGTEGHVPFLADLLLHQSVDIAARWWNAVVDPERLQLVHWIANEEADILILFLPLATRSVGPHVDVTCNGRQVVCTVNSNLKWQQLPIQPTAVQPNGLPEWYDLCRVMAHLLGLGMGLQTIPVPGNVMHNRYDPERIGLGELDVLLAQQMYGKPPEPAPIPMRGQLILGDTVYDVTERVG